MGVLVGWDDARLGADEGLRVGLGRTGDMVSTGMTDGAEVGDLVGRWCGSTVGEEVGGALDWITLGRATAAT